MKTWFLDASVLLARGDADDLNHDAARQLLEGEVAVATLDLAFYEATNVAIAAWKDPAAAQKLREVIAAVANDAGLVRVDASLIGAAAELADEHGISVYDAAYVAAATACGAQLVSCDMRDIVSRHLAITPADALAAHADF
jgi:predicted nucleic acid-binding protein